jgi:hypothetical protein
MLTADWPWTLGWGRGPYARSGNTDHSTRASRGAFYPEHDRDRSRGRGRGVGGSHAAPTDNVRDCGGCASHAHRRANCRADHRAYRHRRCRYPKPAACDKIYSPGMVAAFGDLVLNPAWTTDPGSDVREGSDDPQLLAVINNTEHLSCHWVSPVGPSGSGVVTNLVWVTAEQTQAVGNRLRELALNCYEELGGLRCITETRTEEGISGQSHFLRDGIWLATQFINAGPDGYTHDMVATLWHGA